MRAGNLSYPYSVREQVGIVRHLQAFPQDPLSLAIDNVTSFDRLDPLAMAQLRAVFERQGVALRSSAAPPAVELAEEVALAPAVESTLPAAARELRAAHECAVTSHELPSRNVGYLFDAAQSARPLEAAAREIIKKMKNCTLVLFKI